MRFGRHHARPEEPVWNEPLRAPDSAPQPAGGAGRELFVRYARKDGRLVAMLRGVDQGGSFLIEAEVHPQGADQPVRRGPYTFADADEATAFVAETVTALTYLGCDVQER
jgi:hypothetical protein